MRGIGSVSGSIVGGSQSWAMVLRVPKVFCPVVCLGGWHQPRPGSVPPHYSVGLGLRHRTSEATVCLPASHVGAE